ncbi:MAG: type II toxin-antitoxin system VapC family toxin [Anaerolineae bacterium]
MVDTSVAVKYFLDESLSDRATSLFRGLVRPPTASLFAPTLLYSEFGNVLWKRVRGRSLAPESASGMLDDLLRLPIHAIPSHDLLRHALPLALAHDITVYDALYAALARMLQLPLITADERLVRKLGGSGVETVSLAEYEGG